MSSLLQKPQSCQLYQLYKSNHRVLLLRSHILKLYRHNTNALSKMEVDGPEFVSEEYAEEHADGQEVESKQPATINSALARRREAILKKKENVDKMGDAEEAMLKRRADGASCIIRY